MSRAYHHARITCGRELCECLRAGPYAWPGGYALAFITSDGGTLSYQAVRENLYQVISAIRYGSNDGWQVIGQLNTADCDDEIICDHTGEIIS